MKHHVDIDGERLAVDLSQPDPATGVCTATVHTSQGAWRWRVRSDASGTVTVYSEAQDLGSDARPSSLELRCYAAMGNTVRAMLSDGAVVEGRVANEHDRLRDRARRKEEADSRSRLLESPIPGVVRSILCSVGDGVETGTPLVTLEAMKMENELRAESPGRVAEILCRVGEPVAASQALVRLDPPDSNPAPPRD